MNISPTSVNYQTDDVPGVLTCALDQLRNGKTNDALIACRKMVRHASGEPEILYICAMIAHHSGDLDLAINWVNQAIRIDPHRPDFNLLSGRLHLKNNAVKAALRRLKTVLRFSPNNSEAICCLGEAYARLNQSNRALKCFKKTTEMDPQAVNAHLQAASLLMDMDRRLEAVGHLLSVVENNPSDWQIWVNLCSYLRDCDELLHAKDCGHKAVALNPLAFEAWHNLANVYLDMKCYQISFEHYEKAHECNPGQDTVICNLLNVSMMLCDWERTEYYGKMLDELTECALKKGERPGETPFVNISRCDDPQRNFTVARVWSRDIQSRMARPHLQSRLVHSNNRRGKIRIGYISNNFRNHPTGHITRQLYRNHDRHRFEVYCFSYGPDDKSQYGNDIRHGCDHFVDIRKFAAAESAIIINDCGIDILVDLVGHLRGNRMAIAALRPAPIQVRWLGMAGTTGADFFDYIITDRTVTPQNQQRAYTEKFVYMPYCYQINDDTPYCDDAPLNRSEAGLPEDAFVFCCFNTSYKIDVELFDSWMNILKLAPHGVLWLLEHSREQRLNLEKSALKCGLDESRLTFAPKVPKDKHLARLSLADLVLDTVRVNGAASTSDALWAGVPVLTVRGSHFASRMSTSILIAIGLDSLVVGDLKEYETRAVALSNNGLRIKKIKKMLKKKSDGSHLFDVRGFVSNLEQSYEIMLNRHLSGKNPCQINLKALE